MAQIITRGTPRPIRHFRIECSCGTVVRFADHEAKAWLTESGELFGQGEAPRADAARERYCVPVFDCPVCKDIHRGTPEERGTVLNDLMKKYQP